MSSTTTRWRRWRWPALLLIVSLCLVGSYLLIPRVTTDRITVHLPAAVGLYAGDDVRVLGITVGTVTSVTPRDDRVDVELAVKKSQPIPAQATAVVLNQSLVSGRFIQLTPAYTGGDTLADGATIGVERTAVPVEWNEIADQLQKVATQLGPSARDVDGPFGDVINSAANNLDGQGQTLRSTLTSVSAALQTVSQGRTDLFGIVRNLQIFVSALAGSDAQIVSFNNRMMSVTGILDNNRDDLSAALGSLDGTLGQVRDFIRDNRSGMTQALQRLGTVAETLATKRDDIAQVLHVAPTALANLTSIYQPAHNTVVSALAMTNFANPVQFVCSAIAAAEATTAERGANLCVRYLGPLLRLLTMDYPPIAANPTRGVSALPGQVIYSGVAAPGNSAGSRVNPTPTRVKSIAQLLVPGQR